MNIGHIQWLDMHDWKERRAASGAAREQWYQSKFAEIVRVLESDESRRFAGEISTLDGHLKPIRSYARINHLLKKGLVGRTLAFRGSGEMAKRNRARIRSLLDHGRSRCEKEFLCC